MVDTPCMQCTRCQRAVAVEYENSPAARRWWKLYFTVPLFLLPASPFLAADFAVCLPLMMAYMVGVGPVLAIVREQPTCGECGALILQAEQAGRPARSRAECVP
ncbi:hypothetical protein [Nannocystis pusilla]|uniref:Uncharacterized protein n=1 Tax=Nannocystis pusilla TaxID=889268 RepID=A0ABS7TPP9_9BACT|nr:hypothetical protein [Nannocystis pusilla]MBZ5710117.1 hypothetical protein [Nannocystis pusilla]